MEFAGQNIPNFRDYQCEQVNVERDNDVNIFIIYSTDSTITRISIAKNEGAMESFGPSAGSASTGVLRLQTQPQKDHFFGFATQIGPEDVDVIDAIGLVRYEPDCLKRYKGFV